ncbi:hypothetical protein FRC96_11305 [Lujinxingia vulgaris]|uniref:DUF600 domain-containing protein n=1 Tax=Lujinxingia vulgaris TaxID=2600176 RepID=A0A5C6XB17_9DELT|nr:hypothetical protein [Lujinxingia vulgaris]TXD35259.1 hypothetical protein FRC96_11305 [Lujinxingia vulgaris]
MSKDIQAALITEIGEMIAGDDYLQAQEWQGLGLVVTIQDGTRRMTGFRYLEDGSFEADTPDNGGDVMRKLRELKHAMIANGDGAFVQCLIHLTRPDYELRLQFEFDDPTRWKPKKISMDMSEFADLLRPE